MKILAFALSVIGTVCICGCSLIKGKDMRLILILAFLSNVFVGASYILTDAWNGAVSCGVGAAQTIINYFFERKQKSLPMWLVYDLVSRSYGPVFTHVCQSSIAVFGMLVHDRKRIHNKNSSALTQRSFLLNNYFTGA